MDKEIEIQVRVEHIKPLKAFLEKNSQPKANVHQIDRYFTPAHRDFISSRPVNEWLRLRDTDGKYSINYKFWHFDSDGKSHYGEEYESGVENLDQLNKIFSALNLREVVEVNKNRQIWLYQNFEISIDQVKNLGDFVEVEYKGIDDIADPKRITDQMLKLLKDIGCGRIFRNYVGYPFQILFPEEYQVEEL